MITLDTKLIIPGQVVFSVVGRDAFILNTRTNDYFSLEEVGTRLWELLKDGKSLREGFNLLLKEYDVEQGELERDMLELVGQFIEKGLVEVAASQD